MEIATKYNRNTLSSVDVLTAFTACITLLYENNLRPNCRVYILDGQKILLSGC